MLIDHSFGKQVKVRENISVYTYINYTSRRVRQINLNVESEYQIITISGIMKFGASFYPVKVLIYPSVLFEYRPPPLIFLGYSEVALIHQSRFLLRKI